MISIECQKRTTSQPSRSLSWAEIAEEWRVGAFVGDTNQGVTDPTGLLPIEGLVDQNCEKQVRCGNAFSTSQVGVFILSHAPGSFHTGPGRTADPVSTHSFPPFLSS
jgi:hypothetical protein